MIDLAELPRASTIEGRILVRIYPLDFIRPGAHVMITEELYQETPPLELANIIERAIGQVVAGNMPEHAPTPWRSNLRALGNFGKKELVH